MTLTTHAVGGAAVAVALHAHPALGILAAFGSHFVLDAIPHWDHQLRSRTRDPHNSMNDRITFWSESFFKDVATVSADGILGLAITGIAATATHPDYLWLTLAGAVCGILPDALQFVYYVAPESPIRYLQRFHRIAHAKTHLNNRPWLGISTQLIIIGILIFIFPFL